MTSRILARAGLSAPAIHYHSHASLLRPYKPGGRAHLDGIIVSAARRAPYLRQAFRLAAKLRAPVVVMCSQATNGESAVEQAAAIVGATYAILDMSAPRIVNLPNFGTSAFIEAQMGSQPDLSRKRNLGLALGTLLGWRAMLFLDDDIYGLDPSEIVQAVAALDYFAAVGIPARYFPDNSVVCHANRLSGGRQGVFVSGSVLAIDLRKANSFFPDTYNEDWLFLAPHLYPRNVCAYGSARQHRYAPFNDPQRAGAQEFGDVLAEGLIGFLHSAKLRQPPSIEYWDAFLESRAKFILRAMHNCRKISAHDALAALEVAEQTRSKISAFRLASYVDAWLQDLDVWRRFLNELPRVGSLTDAIRVLDLQVVTRPSPHNYYIPDISSPRHLSHQRAGADVVGSSAGVLPA